MNKNFRQCFVLATAALAGSLAALPALAQNTRLIHPADAVVAGRTMAQWAAEWSQYVLSSAQTPQGAPIPLADMTGEACSLMQHGPVWFLVGTGSGPATRACTLPEGKSLLLPLINLIDFNVANQPVAELRAEAAGCMDAASHLRLQVDGVAVPPPVLEALRVKSAPFEVVLPPGNGSTAASVYSPGINDGYYAMLTPLPPGQHTVRFGGATAGCYYAPTNFQVLPWSVDVTYHLTVKPVSLR